MLSFIWKIKQLFYNRIQCFSAIDSKCLYLKLTVICGQSSSLIFEKVSPFIYLFYSPTVLLWDLYAQTNEFKSKMFLVKKWSFLMDAFQYITTASAYLCDTFVLFLLHKAENIIYKSMDHHLYFLPNYNI